MYVLFVGATAMLSVGGGFGRGPTRASAPPVINYMKTTVPYSTGKQQQVPPRLKVLFDS